MRILVELDNGAWGFRTPELEEALREYNKVYVDVVRKRVAEYPSLADKADAEYHAYKGNVELLDEWYDKQEAIKQKYPKPDKSYYGLA